MKSHPNNQNRAQRGVSLVVVLVMLLLSTLLVLGGSRLANLNELLASSDTDAQRSLEAAQILMRDAELDIFNTAANKRPQGLALSFKDTAMLQDLTAIASVAGAVTCVNAICSYLGDAANGGAASFWSTPKSLADYTQNNRSATYGQWSGISARTAADSSNPIVAASPARAWYWIELLPYAGFSAVWARTCAPPKGGLGGSAQFLFRITTVALGRNDTPTVLQQVFIPDTDGGVTRCPD